MIRRSWLILALALVFTVGTLQAANDREIKHEKREIRQDKREIARTRALHERLVESIDMWHNAWLKSDRSQVRDLRQRMMLALIDDVKKSNYRLNRHESESRRSQIQTRQNQSDRHGSRQEAADDAADMEQAREVVRGKTRLLQALNSTESFSIQYRLLGDYLGLLRRELGMARLELAEDVSELREDRRARP